jgi:signal transduction histidine kinase/HAMP domain-containing protein
MSFRARTILGIGLVQVVLLIALTYALLAFGERVGRVVLDRRADTAIHLATAVLRDAVIASDLDAVRRLAGELVDGAELESARVTDPADRLLAVALRQGDPDAGTVQRRRAIVAGGETFGHVAIAVSTERVRSALAMARAGLGAFALVSLGVSVIVSFVLGSYLTRRFDVIRDAARNVAAGNFDISLAETGTPEFRALARGMNTMSRRIRDLYGDLQRTLASRTRTLDSTFAHMSQGVAIFAADGALIAANDAFADLLGFPANIVKSGVTLDALVDLHVAQGLYGEGEQAAAAVALCRQINWPGPSLTFELPFPDGRIITAQRTRLPDGGFIAIHEDVTRQREDQRRLLHAAKLATLGELATATAHELNQPLNVIRLSADNARARLTKGIATTDYLAEKLERISAQTTRAASIIDHMRIFGRKPVETPAPFDLSAAVHAAVDFFKETARLRGCRIELNVTPGLIIRGHSILIEQVVANILSNALAAFRPDRAGSDSPCIRIHAARDEAGVLVEIADNAGGIPPEVLPRIFEPFFTTKPGGEGTGLGLSISYGIVSDMGGRLEARNDRSGAVFSFRLPAHRGAGAEPAPAC